MSLIHDIPSCYHYRHAGRLTGDCKSEVIFVPTMANIKSCFDSYSVIIRRAYSQCSHHAFPNKLLFDYSHLSFAYQDVCHDYVIA